MQNRRLKNRSINFKEGCFHTKTLTTPSEKNQAYRLRYEVFSREFNWIKPNSPDLDIDPFDTQDVILMGVFNLRTVAYLRISLSYTTFLMEKEFDFLISEHLFEKTSEVIEVSRVCTSPVARKEYHITPFGTYTLAMQALQRALPLVTAQHCFNYVHGNRREIESTFENLWFSYNFDQFTIYHA